MSIRKLALAGAGLSVALATAPCPASERPNIVLILLDDVGVGWLPPYAERLKPTDIEPEVLRAYERHRNAGRELDLQAHIEAAKACMPALSQLAKQGAVFERCFATASLCAPSRAGLLTGTFQQRWGAYSNAEIDDHGIPADRKLLAESLRAAGYRCGMVGKWHVAKKDESIKETIWTTKLGESLPIPPGYRGRWPELSEQLKGTGYRSSSAPGQNPLDRGFDCYFGYNSHDSKYYGADDLWDGRKLMPKRPQDEFLTELFNEKSLEFVRKALKDKAPFFLYHAPMTLHGGIVPPPPAYTKNFATGIPFSDEYAGHLLALDEGIRRIMETLTESGQLANTLFVVTSDNGCTLYNVPPYNAPNRGGKGTGWLGGINVPLVITRPGTIKPGIHREVVSLADIMPTALAAACLPEPPGIDGRNLMPLLRGETTTGPRTGLGSAGLHSTRWSYSYETGGGLNAKDAQECPLYAWYLEGDKLLVKTTSVRPGLYKALPGGLPASTRLFDFANDRHQRTDLAAAETDIGRKLEASLHDWLGGMKEPLASQQDDYKQLLGAGTP